jgi:S-formylglutathione hydrolase
MTKSMKQGAMKTIRCLGFVSTIAACVSGLLFSQTHAPAEGTLQRIKVHGESLAGNLEGDSPDRDVSIYLPPGYETARRRHYPVIYLLHGYLLTDQYWTVVSPRPDIPAANLPAAMNRAIASGAVKPMIVVMPNAYTIYAGSMYSSSITTGDWESYISHDLVSYVDRHYRTIPDRMSRGLAGHSMGGYGAIRIGMKHPEVFSSLYVMSACCLMDNPIPRARRNVQSESKQPQPDTGTNPKGQRGSDASQVTLARAAAWSPNAKNPPQFLDLPTQDGELQPLVIAKWAANSPLAMIDQYVTNLKEYHAIAGDVGLQDTLAAVNEEMSRMFTDSGIVHTFETYEGNHTNKIPERIETKVFPFFSKNLSFARRQR